LVEYHDKEELIELVRKVVMKSARVVIYPHSNKALMICYVQIDGMKEIMSINPGEAKVTKTFLIYNMLKRSTFDYARCFDAVKKEWLPIHQVCT